MIFAKFQDAAEYRGIHPRLDKALDLIDNAFLKTVGIETMQLEDDKLYVTRFDYETLPFEDTFYEAHRKYLDIHILLSGEERVDISHPDTLSQFEHKDDFYAYTGSAEQTIVLRPGTFLVVFPGDAHRIKICTDKPAMVSKAVFKVLYKD